jgi:protein gp37
MADNSAIEWTEATWNPVTGCDQVSPGCAHCYAKTFAERWRGISDHPYEQGFDLRLWPQRLEQPLKWTRPRMIFVNSMSDLFHEDVPLGYIEQVFDVMGRAEHHTFQILTKRHARLAALASALAWHPNVWIGVSIENRRFVHRADYLRRVDAAIRFISAEPLLGPLDGLDLSGIDWLIAGGESGPKHRPVRIEWAAISATDALRRTSPSSSSSGAGVRPRPVGGISTIACGARCHIRAWQPPRSESSEPRRSKRRGRRAYRAATWRSACARRSSSALSCELWAACSSRLASAATACAPTERLAPAIRCA